MGPCCVPPASLPLQRVSGAPSLPGTPPLVQCEGKACGVGVTGPMERASHFPGKGGLEGGGGLEVAEGKPVGW